MKKVLNQIITDMQERYNENRNSKFEFKIEIAEYIHELRELAGLDRDECEECHAIGCSMVNGKCYECEEERLDNSEMADTYKMLRQVR
jgi:hypothetical protein